MMRSITVSETQHLPCCSFLQCKTFGSHKIPEGWLIMAASNPPSTINQSVNLMRDHGPCERKSGGDPDFVHGREYVHKKGKFHLQ